MFVSQKTYHKIELFSVVILLVLDVSFASKDEKYDMETRYMDVPIDHFSLAEYRTFPLRYLVYSKYHGQDGPMFVYIGSKENILTHAKTFGFLFDIASKFNALLVFIEHRYYGDSLPFGSESFSSFNNLKYLSTTQALADFAYVIDELEKEKNSMNYLESHHSSFHPSIIAFGTSYGGIMAAWLRIKYPLMIHGTVSSSTPYFYSPKFTRCNAVYDKVTSIFEKHGNQKCVDLIQRVWTAIAELSQDQTGKNFISYTWNLCHRMTSSEDVERLLKWLSNMYVKLASMNYAYIFEYDELLPALPVKMFCDKLTSGNYDTTRTMVELFGDALQIFTNFTRTKTCNEIHETFEEYAWDFQTCSEIIWPMCSTENDMFITRSYDYDQFRLDCYIKFGIKYLPDSIALNYNLKYFELLTNMLFVNNMMDPFSEYGFYLNISDSITHINIDDSPTFMDLRKSSYADLNYVIEARAYIVSIIDKWLTRV